MSDELAALDATEAARWVREGRVSPRELVDGAIARIEKLNGPLNAVITPLFEAARSAADAALPDGPFRGVPFLLKDLDTLSAGEPFHAGMAFLKQADYRPGHSSYLTEKFRNAGLVTVGKTNTPELGLQVTTEPDAYGPSRNPWNTEYSTGGSSGGSAAAVAAGMVPAAHASDGGGSIRVPASECGLVGLKPSRGRVSLGPEYGDYWDGLVISHVVSRSVRDTAGLLDAVAGEMPGDPYTARPPLRAYVDELTREPGRLRIGLMTRSPAGAPDCDAECVGAVGRPDVCSNPSATMCRLRTRTRSMSTSDSSQGFRSWSAAGPRRRSTTGAKKSAGPFLLKTWSPAPGRLHSVDVSFPPIDTSRTPIGSTPGRAVWPHGGPAASTCS